VVSLPTGTVQPAVHLAPSGCGLGQNPHGTQLWVIDPSNNTVYFMDEHTLSTATPFFLGAGTVPTQRRLHVRWHRRGRVGREWLLFFFQISN